MDGARLNQGVGPTTPLSSSDANGESRLSKESISWHSGEDTIDGELPYSNINDALDAIVKEYRQKIEELACLTAELPVRLQRNGSFAGKCYAANRKSQQPTQSHGESMPTSSVRNRWSPFDSHLMPASTLSYTREMFSSDSRFSIQAVASIDAAKDCDTEDEPRQLAFTPRAQEAPPVLTPRATLSPRVSAPLKELRTAHAVPRPFHKHTWTDDDDLRNISRDFEELLTDSNSSTGQKSSANARVNKRVSLSVDTSYRDTSFVVHDMHDIDKSLDKSMDKSHESTTNRGSVETGTTTNRGCMAVSSNFLSSNDTSGMFAFTNTLSSPRRIRARARQVSALVAGMHSGTKTWMDTDSEVYEVLSCCFPCLFQPKGSTGNGKRCSTSDKIAADRIFSGVTNVQPDGKFDILVGMLIMANCIVMMIQLEYQGHLGEVSIGKKEDQGQWPNADTWFYVLEHVFNGLFLLELTYRFAVHGWALFKDRSLVFDAFLVSVSSLQIYLIDPLSKAEDGRGGGGAKMSLFRMLRFIRFVRVLRLVRVLRMFSALRVLVKTVVSSFGALVWSMVLLLVIMIMGGLFLSELLKDFVMEESNDMAIRIWVFKHYGTSTRAIYTLFEVTLAGCWPNYFRPLIHSVSGWYVVFALGYISVVVFAIIRIITAIFLKETLQIASNDAEMMVHERLKHKESYVKKLENLFKAVDVSGDGTLSEEEFEVIVSNPMVRTWLQVLELEVHDAKALFRLLDDGDGSITYDEFLTGLMRLKGQARTMDVVSIMRNTDKTLAEVRLMKGLLVKINGIRPSVVESIPSEPLNRLDSCRT